MTSLISNIKSDFINFNTAAPNKTRGTLLATSALIAVISGCVITALGVALVYFSPQVTRFLFSSMTNNFDHIVLLWLSILSLGIGLTVSGVPIGTGLAYKTISYAKRDFGLS